MNKLLITLLALACSLNANAEDKPLRITASDWPPYISQQLYSYGVAMSLTAEALRRAGYESAIAIQQWPKSMESVRDGGFDIATAVWRTEEREQDLLFSEPFLTNYIVLVKRHDDTSNYIDRADLGGLRVGIVADYAYRDQQYDTTGIEVLEAGSARANLQKLLGKELDLVLADSRVASYEIDQLIAAKELTVIRKPLNTRSLRIAVSRQHPQHEEIVEAFNASIAQMRTDGSYDALLATFRVTN